MNLNLRCFSLCLLLLSCLSFGANSEQVQESSQDKLGMLWLTQLFVVKHVDYQPDGATIAFAPIAIQHRHKLQYRIVREGETWRPFPQKNNHLSFEQLTNGNYRLQLRQKNQNGQWLEPITVFTFHHRLDNAHFSQSYLLWIIIFVLFIAIIRYSRYERRKAAYTQKLNRTLERRVAERTLQLQQQKEEVEQMIAERTAQLQQSNQSIVSLSEICSHISSTLGFEELLMTAYRYIRDLMDADIFLIGLYEPSQQKIDFQLIVDNEHYLPDYSLSINENERPAVWCYKHQEPMIINDMDKEYKKYFDQRPDMPPNASQPVASIMYWPLMVGGQIIGVLSVQSYKPSAYHTYQQHTIATLASTTAIALDHARAYREVERQRNAVEQKVTERTMQLQHRTKQLQQINLNITAVRNICIEISSTLNMKELPYRVYSRIRALMDTDVFMIGLYDEQLQTIEFEVALKNHQMVDAMTLHMAETNRPAVWCVENRQPMIVNNIRQDLPRYFGNMQVDQLIPGQKVESFVYWPLVVGNKILGVMTVQSHQVNAYNEHHQDMIATIAATTAVALDNASAYEEVELKNHEILRTQKNLLQSEKLASLGTLTAGVAHEINNPTNFVHVSAENLEVDLDDFREFIFNLAGEDADDSIINSFRRRFEPLYLHLRTIKDGTLRIKTIVKDLRSFTHVDVEEKQTVEITNTLNSTINLAKSRYKEIAEVKTTFVDSPKLSCHPAQLSQVFVNLIVNACDAIKTKQETLLAEKLSQLSEQDESLSDNELLQSIDYKGQINVSCQEFAEHVKITIEDNGCGMSETTKNKLFEPFYTTKVVGEGTGLGLSISYGIIEKHQGKLLVESEIGVGSTFSMIIPKVTGDEPKQDD